jgi:hypothetical protein
VKKLQAILTLLCCSFLLASCSSLGYSSAISECQELVKDRLRSPGSASFADVEIEEIDDSYFEIRGSVDAQNGFGALLRASFKCSGYDKGDVKLIYISDPR